MNKPVLAIETSDFFCSACIYFSEERFFSAKAAAKHSHSEMLFKVIDTVINTADIQKSDIIAIAVSEGPGSFTGLRIGMSAAKGLAFGLSIPIIPVPTFEALALQAASLFEDEEIVIANKVNTQEVYFAKFHVKMNNYIFTEELKIRQSSELELLDKSIKKLGNAFSKPLTSSPEPESVARWAVNFGESTKTNDIDNLEPFYLKNFIVKEKKNVK